MWQEGKFEIEGNVFKYCAKVFDEVSKFGINSGRISKLEIIKDTGVRSYINEPVVLYDREWVVKPRSNLAKKALEYVLNLFK